MYDVDGLGIRIAHLRKEKNLTQEAFARSLGVSAQAVSKWETGIGYPDITLLPQIAEELGISIEQLFGKEPEWEQEEITAEPFPFPEKRGSLQLVGSLGEIAAYADAPGKQHNAVITFDDGSEVNLETQTIINHGKNRITLAYADELEISGAELNGEDEIESDSPEVESNQEQEDISDKKGFSYAGPGVSSSDTRGKSEDMPTIDSYDITVAGACKVLIIHTPDEKHRWQAEGTPDFMRALSVEQIGSTLHISADQSRRFFFGSSNIKGQINLYTPMLNMNRIRVSIKGSGDLASQVNFEESDLQIAGSGGLRLAKSGLTDVKISGSGDFYSTQAHNANINIAGSGDVTIDHVSGKVVCKIAGSGDIDFRGGELEELSVRIAGSGDLDAAKITVENLDISIQGGGDAVIGCVRGSSVERISRGAKLTILNRAQ